MSFCDNLKKPIGNLKVYTLTLSFREDFWKVSHLHFILINANFTVQFCIISKMQSVTETEIVSDKM